MYPIKTHTNFRHYFSLFVLLNFLFLGLQFVYFWLVSLNFFHTLPMPRNVHLIVIGEGGLQIILYLLLALVQLGWLWGIASQPGNQTASFKPVGLKRWLFLIFTVSTIFILSLNCYFFPLSRFSRIFFPELPITVLKLLLVLSSLILIGLTVNTLRGLNFKKSTKVVILSGLAFFLFLNNFLTKPTQFPTYRNPNIILIGIDSFSPEYVKTEETPTLERFLQESAHFTETISPLARTYPAWTSILTGLYPLHHRARENLIPMQYVKTEASIVWRLRELGYSTLFATDDRRFSNLDQEFGFQKVIGPKIGVNEMLLGNFYDFPLSNLLMNSKISHWLFPYNYLNRASNYVYYPATFDTALEAAINESETSGPLFLATHFTLPHWPYSWAASSNAAISDEYTINKDDPNLYKTALKRVDKQVSTLLDNLSRHNLLTNSLVIVLSDHGEALYQKGSRITSLQNYQGNKPSPLVNYFKHKTSTDFEKSAGHGSDLLSPTQFHCLLGFKIFQNGKQINRPKIINTRVALIDIAPTIYQFLNLPSQHELRHFDGESLLPTILGATNQLAPRPFMLESGLLPNQLLSVKKALFYARLFYQVNRDNNLLEIRANELSEINAMKLYGILENDWLLVLYPNNTHYLPVLIQLSNLKWTDQPSSAFAKNSPFKKLLTKLRAFYKIELADYPAPPFQS